MRHFLLIFADTALIHRPTTTTTNCIAADFHDNGGQMVENAEFVETLGIQQRYGFRVIALVEPFLYKSTRGEYRRG